MNSNFAYKDIGQHGPDYTKPLAAEVKAPKFRLPKLRPASNLHSRLSHSRTLARVFKLKP